ENNHVVSKQSIVYETASFKEKTIDMIEITNYQMKGENLLKDQTLGYLPETLTKKHTLMDLTLEAMKDYGGQEVSLLNTGIILTDLKEGVVTKKDLHECLPHPMNLIKVKLKGRDVKRLVYEIERSRDFLFKFE